jgi:hypothetical protein
MYCPQCGANQSDELRFCNLCGANLYAVRQVIATGKIGEKLDWNKTWMADMFLSEEERGKRKQEIKQGIDLEAKRHNEIRGGVITCCVGVGLMIFLYVFMQGIIKGAGISADVGEILSRIWIAGIFPIFAGIGLLINGLFVSKRLVKVAGQKPPAEPNTLKSDAARHSLRQADTTEFIRPDFSVTEDTTKHLNSSGQNQ